MNASRFVAERRPVRAAVAAAVWALLSTLISTPPAWATAIGSWSYTSSLQAARAGHGMASEGNTLYVLGGHDATNGAIRSVEYAASGAGGGLSAWGFGTTLNTARTLTTAIAVGGHVYAIGGARHWSLIGQELDSVEFAAIQSDGSLGPWQFTAALTGPRANAVALAHGGFIYVVGGYGDGQLDSVECAAVLPDGTLGPWAVISHMSRPRERPGAAITSNTLVVLGGFSSGAGIVSTTERAPILANGMLGAWTTGPAMSVPRYHLSAVSIDDLVFALGGYNDGQPQAWPSTEETEVAGAGAGLWTPGAMMQEPRSSLAASVSGRHVYVSGGTHGLFGAWDLITSSVEVAVSAIGGGATLSVGGYHSCAKKAGGVLVCWGWDNDGQVPAPANSFTEFSAGGYHTCGIKEDRTVACWGLNNFGQATPPPGAFAEVSAGWAHSCGVRSDGSLACWGLNGNGQASPPIGTFSAVGSGVFFTCGVGTDGTLRCWGDNTYGQATPPGGPFLRVSVGAYHACEVRTDGSVACWGYDIYGQANPVPGEFTQVSTGGYHTCGLRTDGTVTCWGLNDHGQASPPAGEFLEVGAGWVHTCGLRADLSVSCWGDNSVGQATPPNDFFGLLLSVGVAGTGRGIVTSTPGGISCPGDCSQAFPDGTSVILTATPAPDSIFAGWGGDAACATGIITLAADTDCTSTFSLAFRDVRRPSDINLGLDLGRTGHSALNFTGSAGSGGDTWISVYDTTPGDATPTVVTGSLSLSADVLIHRYDNKKGAGLLALYNKAAGKKGLALILYDAGNTDTLALATVDQAGKLTALKSTALGGGILQNAWYRVTLDVGVVGSVVSVTGKVFRHVSGRDPDSALGGQVGSTLTFTGPRPAGVDGAARSGSLPRQ